MTDLTAMTAADLGRAIDTGRADPRDVVEAYLAAAAAHPDSPRIYARMTADRARAEAAAAAARTKAGLRRHPLDGVPVSWKDLYDTAGTATEAGSALLAGRVPDRDADVLATATLQGSVCLGKTHMTELAFSGLGLNPVTASPPCINDPAAVSGGSSSGAAASVAHCLAPLAIGSDTGGSVRVPSAWNDLVGLKTTHGRLPLTGVVPLCPRFDTVGPLARTVEDAALALSLLDGTRPADLTGASLHGVRFLVLDTVALDALAPAVQTAFEATVERLARGPATVTRASLPEVAEAMALTATLFAPEAWGTWGAAIAANPGAMFPPVRERFEGGKAASAAEYVAAWQRLEILRAAFHAATAAFDAVLTPTIPTLPPPQAAVLADPARFTAENLMALRNTRIGNLMGSAALTLPTGTPSVGLQLIGPPGSEAHLLRLGAAVEAALAD
jgi:aspartyl-tRNA(Asn)/glutamyl-tRNA(Gln) amidotransferase subunit A